MKLFISLVFISFLFISGCVNESDVDNKKIDSDIVLTFKEIIDTTGRSLQVYCKTAAYYPSGNYGINYQIQNNGNKILINFTGIYEPEKKDGTSASASTIINLGPMLSGKYSFQILVNESFLDAELNKTEEYYSTGDTSVNGIKISNPLLRRIPEKSIWGHVGYSSDPFVVGQVKPFFDKLLKMGVKELNLAEGDYTYFTIDSAGVMSQPENPGTINARPFVYSYNGNISDLRTLIKTYGKSSPLSIKLCTTYGDVFYTWQLAEED